VSNHDKLCALCQAFQNVTEARHVRFIQCSINLIKQDAFLIVISRGKIIDEAALIASLKEGRLAGAGLDVTYTEPLPPDDPLWDAPNIIITPHCSAASKQTQERTLAIARENLRRFVAGEPLTNVCDTRAGF